MIRKYAEKKILSARCAVLSVFFTDVCLFIKLVSPPASQPVRCKHKGAETGQSVWNRFPGRVLLISARRSIYFIREMGNRFPCLIPASLTPVSFLPDRNHQVLRGRLSVRPHLGQLETGNENLQLLPAVAEKDLFVGAGIFSVLCP